MKLSDLKEGDKVYHSSNTFGQRPAIIKITKVTPTMIICGKCKFNRESGKCIKRYDAWHFEDIQILTKELQREIYHGVYVNKLSHYDFRKLTLEQLRQVWMIIGKSVTAEKDVEK